MKRNEKCVLCGKSTEVETLTAIKQRKYYVSGSGQLCKECYDKIFSKNK